MVTDKPRRIQGLMAPGLLLVLLMAVAGWSGPGWAGQQPATSPEKKATPASKAAKAPAKAPASKSAVKPAQAPAAKPAAAKPAAKAAVKPAKQPAPAAKPAKPAAAPARVAQKPAAPKAKPKETTKKAAAPAPAPARKAPAELSTASGRRDPFKLPVYAAPGPGQASEGEMVTGPLPPGKRGLLISQLILQGIVRLDTSNQMIAVVTNYSKRAYFLRENDTLYNGLVSKITPDSVTFRENYLDSTGHVETREVTRRLGPASGEGR